MADTNEIRALKKRIAQLEKGILLLGKAGLANKERTDELGGMIERLSTLLFSSIVDENNLEKDVAALSAYVVDGDRTAMDT